MGWHFLRVVNEKTNVASRYESQMVCSVPAPVDKPLSLIESLMSRKGNEFSEIPRCILEPDEKN